MTHPRPVWRSIALLVAALGLVAFYVIAADTHGQRINTSKARGDQSGYLWDAQHVYRNWHGRRPPELIGERNRMPLYAGYLALFYRRGLSDPEYFEVGKRANIGLSLVILATLGLAFSRSLPRHVALNLLGIVAFGWFVYKAAYTQADLLFYGLFFFVFLGAWHLCGSISGWRAIGLAALTGGAAGLAHLTKAAMPPFVVLLSGLLFLRAGWATLRGHRQEAGWHAATAATFVLLFLTVLAPYLMVSKRVFGHYFYNVNSTFYVWYDDWVAASVGTYRHRDGVGWPDMPASELPSAGRYWREHTLGQIAARFSGGFQDMATKSYQMFGHLPYLIAFLTGLSMVAITKRRVLRESIGERPWLALFLLTYGTTYLFAIAFYHPTSGTGTGRFLLAHMAPLLFAISALLSSRRVRDERWLIGGRSFDVTSFHVLVTAMLTLDVAFRLWPRLMSTYGGF